MGNAAPAGDRETLRRKNLKPSADGGNYIIDLDDLEVGKLLGKGALCKVNKARWKSRNMDVALKTFFVPDLIPEDLNDFKRELILTRQMEHPNIVLFLAGCAEPPNVYLVMELARHGTVSDVLYDSLHRVTQAYRLRVALDIARGMAFLHSKNVIHRDLKPENFLVFSLDADAEAVVKIADLGVAKLKESEEKDMMTQGRGTPQYMAPEIFDGSREYSFPVDVYSFGLIMWELVTREQPYADIKPHFRIPIKVLEGERPAIPEGVPPAWAKLVRRCWHADPSKRPTFKKIVEKLEQFQRDKIFEQMDAAETAQVVQRVNIPLEELEIQEQLGRGALCRVDKAVWKKQNMVVAVKTFYCPDLVPQELADFRRELWLTSQMDHPNLIRFVGGSSEPPHLYLVTELVENGSLWDILHKEEFELTWELRLQMALEIASGMKYLHDKNVLHRDLKSENLLVGDLDGTGPVIRIADLGVARWRRPSVDTPMTMGRGTQVWMAPEIMEGRKDYSFPVDVYSYGIILWELLTREEPFREITPAFQLPVKVIEGVRPKVPPNCPPTYAKLMEQCWHPDPSKRPTFSEVFRRLERMIKEEVVGKKAGPDTTANNSSNNSNTNLSGKGTSRSGSSKKRSPNNPSNSTNNGGRRRSIAVPDLGQTASNNKDNSKDNHRTITETNERGEQEHTKDTQELQQQRERERLPFDDEDEELLFPTVTIAGGVTGSNGSEKTVMGFLKRTLSNSNTKGESVRQRRDSFTSPSSSSSSLVVPPANASSSSAASSTVAPASSSASTSPTTSPSVPKRASSSFISVSPSPSLQSQPLSARGLLSVPSSASSSTEKFDGSSSYPSSSSSSSSSSSTFTGSSSLNSNRSSTGRKTSSSSSSNNNSVARRIPRSQENSKSLMEEALDDACSNKALSWMVESSSNPYEDAEVCFVVRKNGDEDGGGEGEKKNNDAKEQEEDDLHHEHQQLKHAIENLYSDKELSWELDEMTPKTEIVRVRPTPANHNNTDAVPSIMLSKPLSSSDKAHKTKKNSDSVRSARNSSATSSTVSSSSSASKKGSGKASSKEGRKEKKDGGGSKKKKDGSGSSGRKENSPTSLSPSSKKKSSSSSSSSKTSREEKKKGDGGEEKKKRSNSGRKDKKTASGENGDNNGDKRKRRTGAK
ncbi:Serine/threonine-protein kinase HT1 [Balamuthia mandrillaris]